VLIESGIGLAIGVVMLAWGKHVLGSVVVVIALTLLFTGMFVPQVYGVIKRQFLLLGKSVGIGMSWLLLVPFFYICFPLGRLGFKLTGRDPMTRAFEPNTKSYWMPKKTIAGLEHYKRQY
ncbi:MAG: hypothetical protein JXN60_02370, partial [Lentisphaerae bacterium]|nr:hypothetical protein [Lentisphaerota bacterium]